MSHKIFIPMAKERIPSEIKSQLSYEEGYYIEDTPENRKKFEKYIPYGFRKNKKEIQIDLIPKNSWGASLANSLTSECWDSIRKPFIAHFDNRCQICGQRGKQLSKSIKDVDTHEIWEYSPLSSKEKIQTLKGFIAVCSSCHLMFHLGFANIKGKKEITIKRLQRLEKLSQHEVALKVRNIEHLWEERSKFDWKIDVSILKEYGIKELRFKDKTDKSKFIFK